MESSAPCPFRYIYKGRTFCAIAIRERRYTTAEVVPGASCGHLDLGVEVDIYGGAQTVEITYASCAKLVERISDTSACGEGKCPHWIPVDEDRLAALREETLASQRENEGRGLD